MATRGEEEDPDRKEDVELLPPPHIHRHLDERRKESGDEYLTSPCHLLIHTADVKH